MNDLENESKIRKVLRPSGIVVPYDEYKTSCECGRVHLWTMGESNYTCKCGIEYMRDALKKVMF